MDPVTVAMRPLSLPQSDGKIPYVLHISGDFPDPVEPFKTKVIQTLLELTDERFHHRVISINRVNPEAKNATSLLPGAGIHLQERSFPYGIALRYAAPPNGILHRTMLEKLADWIIHRLATENRRPDLIVGHKLTIEGVVARRVAHTLRIPYAISIQGDTDTKVMAFRPDLVGTFRQILADAEVVFPFSPWTLEQVLDRSGLHSLRHRMLPCPTDVDRTFAPVPGTAGLVSVFHLKNYKRKNLKNLSNAMRLLDKKSEKIPGLTIIGGGEPLELAACERLLTGNVNVALAGPMGGDQVRQALNQATAFVLPSLRETFGLVFLEALFAGTPIIYPAGTAVAGYFDEFGFAIPVDARDPHSIAAGIAYACRNETALKAELAQWQASLHARQFMRKSIASCFADGLDEAIGSLPRSDPAPASG